MKLEQNLERQLTLFDVILTPSSDYTQANFIYEDS